MNALLFVLSFLLLFSFIASSSIQKGISFAREMTSFSGRLKGMQKTRNMLEKKKFEEKTRSINKKKTETLPLKKPSVKTFSSHREKDHFPTEAKFNLAPLLSSKEKNSPSYKTACALIKALYGHTSFFCSSSIPHLENVLIEAMMQSSKDPAALSDLYPTDPLLRSLYYKMLLGSGGYDPKTKQGYPALHDYFVIDFAKQKEIHFAFAAKPLLQCVLGNDLAEEIISLEKKKFDKEDKIKTVTKEELQSLLLTQGKQPALWNTVEMLCDFYTKKSHLDRLTYQDPLSKVCCQIDLPSNVP